MNGYRVLARLLLCALVCAFTSVISIASEDATSSSLSAAPSTIEASASPRTLLGHQDAGRLLDEVLQASGVDDPARREGYRQTFEARLEEIGEHLGRRASPYHRARRLHD